MLMTAAWSSHRRLTSKDRCSAYGAAVAPQQPLLDALAVEAVTAGQQRTMVALAHVVQAHATRP